MEEKGGGGGGRKGGGGRGSGWRREGGRKRQVEKGRGEIRGDWVQRERGVRSGRREGVK